MKRIKIGERDTSKDLERELKGILQEFLDSSQKSTENRIKDVITYHLDERKNILHKLEIRTPDDGI